MAAQTELILQTVVKWTETATKALNDIKGSLDWITSAWEKAWAWTKSFTDKLKQNQEWFQALWVWAWVVTAGMVIWIKWAMDSFSEFESTLSWVKAVLNPTSKEFKNISEKARELWRSTQYSSNEVAKSMEMLAKNWLTATQVLEWATDATLALAASTWADLANAADIASSAMLVFWKNTKELDQVVNSITWTTNLSKFGIEDYWLALAQGWWVAKSVWVNFEDFNATIAAISPLFQSGSDAWTSFKTFLLRLIPASNWAAVAMEELWLMTKDWENKFFDSTWKMKSMAEISWLLKTALTWLSDEQKNTALSTIFWTDAMRAAAWIAWTWAEAFIKLSEWIEATSAIDNAKTRMDNFKWTMERMNWAIDDAKISIWTALAPAIIILANAIWSVMVPLSKWASENPKLTAWIVLAITAISALTAWLVALWFIIWPLSAAFTAIWVIIWAITLPITLTIAAIVAIWVAIYEVIKNWDSIKPKLLEFWESIKNYLTQTWETIKNIFISWLNIIKTIWTTVWNWIKAVFNWIWTAIWLLLWLWFQLLTGDFKWFLDNIKVIWEYAWNWIKFFLSTIWEWIKTGLVIAWQWIQNLLSNIWSWIKNIAIWTWTLIKDTIIWIVNAIWYFFWKEWREKIYEWFISMFKWIWEWVSNTFNSIVDWIKSAINSVIWIINSAISSANKIPGVKLKTVTPISWARATWWPVSSWKTYLVWENWPELFTPSNSWQIIPNNRLWSSSWNSINITISWVFGSNAVDEIGDMLVKRLQKSVFI